MPDLMDAAANANDLPFWLYERWGAMLGMAFIDLGKAETVRAFCSAIGAIIAALVALVALSYSRSAARATEEAVKAAIEMVPHEINVYRQRNSASLSFVADKHAPAVEIDTTDQYLHLKLNVFNRGPSTAYEIRFTVDISGRSEVSDTLTLLSADQQTRINMVVNRQILPPLISTTFPLTLHHHDGLGIHVFQYGLKSKEV